MTKEELNKLKEDIAILSEEDQKERNLYLRSLANGEIMGPPVGYPDIDKPWLKRYPESAIKSDIPKMKAYDYIYGINKKYPNQIALSYFGKDITFDELFSNIERVATALKEMGVKHGDIVTMAMATTPEMVYTLYALNRIGAVANTIDPRLTSREIVDKVNKSNSKLLIGIEMTVDSIINDKEKTSLKDIVLVSPLESAPILLKLIGKTKEKKYSKEEVTPWNKFISNGKNYNGKIDTEYVENEPVIILYTGGTTGEPKGVVLTNENFNTMALTQLVSGYDVKREEDFLNFLPPFSAYSIINAIHDTIALGLKTSLVPMFEPNDFPKLMKKYKPNHVMSGPILWDIMMNDKLTKNMDLSFLKSPISGGDSLNIELEKRVNEYLEKNGCTHKIQQGYGMTEVSAAACYSTDISYAPGSVGIPFIKTNIMIQDTNNNEELTYNQDGEIIINTPTMMKEYFKNEKATSDIISTDVGGQRWIRTGDIGHVDENGNIYIVGRTKRIIVRSGNKVFPSTIENLVMEIPGIEQCSVVEMPDAQEKASPIAHIVIDKEHKGKEEQLIGSIEEIVSSKMPSFNVPKKYVFREDIPLTEMSKVDFRTLELESVDFSQNENKIIKLYKTEHKVLKK